MDPSKKSDYSKILLSLIPSFGKSIGNVRLRGQLRNEIEGLGDQLSDQDYWQLRDSLIDKGLIEQGRGKGGSVHRVSAEPEAVAGTALLEPPVKVEADLYNPFHNAITTGYVKENRIKRFISEVTASQGRR